MIERSRLERPELPVEGVLDWIDDGCMLFDQRLDCVYANERAITLFGHALDRLVGRNLRSPFSSAIASELQHAALTAFANGTPTRKTLQDEPTGRWLEAAMYPSSDGLLAIVTDISAQKRAELELAAHAEYLQQLVDQIPAFLWVIDCDLIVQRIEGGRPMMETLDRDRLIGLPQRVITEMGCNAEDTELSLDMHRRTLTGAPGQYRATWKGITLEARIRPLRDREDNIVGIVGVGIDVTEQTRMGEKLRGSEERFRAVVEGGTDLIAILNDDFRVTYASSAHRRTLAIAPRNGRRWIHGPSFILTTSNTRASSSPRSRTVTVCACPAHPPPHEARRMEEFRHHAHRPAKLRGGEWNRGERAGRHEGARTRMPAASIAEARSARSACRGCGTRLQ